VIVTPNDDDDSLATIDEDFAILDQLCAANDPEDEQRLLKAIEEARTFSKAQTRREMGLE
jgi:hypothetical protein